VPQSNSYFIDLEISGTAPLRRDEGEIRLHAELKYNSALTNIHPAKRDKTTTIRVQVLQLTSSSSSSKEQQSAGSRGKNQAAWICRDSGKVSAHT